MTITNLALRLLVNRTIYASELLAAQQNTADFVAGSTAELNALADASEAAAARAAAAWDAVGGATFGGGGFEAGMAADAAAAATAVDASSNSIVADLAAEETAANSASKAFASLQSVIMVLAAVALIGFDAASTKAFSDYQRDMTLIQTQTGASAQEVQNMTSALMQLSPAVATGPNDLATALYHVESVGYSGAQALNLLKTAAEGAQVGNANLEDVTNALVAVFRSGVSGVTNMTQAMGVLNGIVGSGNLRMEDLANSLSSGLLPTATVFGVTLQQVGGALATMTDQGIPAQEAATRLRIAIALLAAPTAAATKELTSIGLTSRDLADTMRSPAGLIGALQLLKTKMDAAGLDAVQQEQLLKNAFGGARSSSGILALIDNLGLFQQKLDTINGDANTFQQDWVRTTQTVSYVWDQFTAAVQVLAIQLGTVLAPAAVVVLQGLTLLAQQGWLMVPLLTALTVLVAGLAVKFAVVLAAGLAQSALDLGEWVIALPELVAEMGGATIAVGAFDIALAPLLITITAISVAVLALTGNLNDLSNAFNLSPLSKNQAQNWVQNNQPGILGWNPFGNSNTGSAAPLPGIDAWFNDQTAAVPQDAQAIIDQLNQALEAAGLPTLQTSGQDLGGALSSGITAGASQAGVDVVQEVIKNIKARQQDLNGAASAAISAAFAYQQNQLDITKAMTDQKKAADDLTTAEKNLSKLQGTAGTTTTKTRGTPQQIQFAKEQVQIDENYLNSLKSTASLVTRERAVLRLQKAEADLAKLEGTVTTSGASTKQIDAAKQKVLDAKQALITASENLQTALSASTELGTAAQRMAAINSILHSSFMKAGLTSPDSDVRTLFANWRSALQSEYNRLKGDASDAGVSAFNNFKKAFSQAHPLANVNIDDALGIGPKGQRQFYSWGVATGISYDSGIAAGIKSNMSAISGAISKYIAPGVRASSPPGPESPIHLIDVWGFKTGEAWAQGLADGIVSKQEIVRGAIRQHGRLIATEANKLGSSAVPGLNVALGTPAGPHLGNALSHTSSVQIGDIHLHFDKNVTPDVAKQAGQTILDVVANGFRDQTNRSGKVIRS